MIKHPKCEFYLVLVLSVKGMNEKEGPDGLVPSALLFEKYPHSTIPENLGRRPTTEERGEIALEIRCEMEDHLEKLYIT